MQPWPPSWPGVRSRVSRRNPLTGLSGLQLYPAWRVGNGMSIGSQSPCGAKWFATTPGTGRSSSPRPWNRNPLTGLSGSQRCASSTAYLRLSGSRNPLTGLSGLQRMCTWSPGPDTRCRNPLTGLSGLQPMGMTPLGLDLWMERSQSPYGAKWFATLPP